MFPLPSWLRQCLCLAAPQGGQHCLNSSLTAPTGDCDAGYYCPHDQNIVRDKPADFACPAGNRCPAGSATPTPCEPGTYQALLGEEFCDVIPERFYTANRVDLLECPVGHYCPAGTEASDQHPCPIGTFNNNTGLNSAAECTICQMGYYCDATGLAGPAGPCGPGYYCMLGAARPDPTGVLTVAVPWRDPASTPSCLDTTVPNGALRLASSQFLCESIGATDLGAPGTWVVSVSSAASVHSARDQGDFIELTIAGLAIIRFENAVGQSQTVHYVGSTLAYDVSLYSNQTDSPFTYMHNTLVQGVATLSTGDQCPAGHYCPTGTADPVQCPAGSFANVTGLAICHPCTPGHYCDVVGLTTPTSTCQAGYYCVLGASIPNPPGDLTGGPCNNGTISNTAGTLTHSPRPRWSNHFQ